MAVEVGGTFTDLIWLDETGQVHAHKVPSVTSDPSIGVIAGLEEALGDRIRDVSAVFHGSTVATNAVLERKGCRAGLLTTRGFGDVLITQRQLRDNVYSVVSKKPAPIIPLSLTGEATERITVKGEIQTPLDEAQLVAEVERLVEERGIEALAICFLHSYRDPVHELRARELITDRFPGIPVVLSSDVLPAFREYERASTTAIAAYLSPKIGTYLSHLEGHLADRAVRAPLFVMQSSGGILPSSGIRARPTEMLNSGPAAGVIAAIRIAERLGDQNLITLDMGGTSTDVCLIRNGAAEITSERALDGLPVGMPSVDIANVGAGGGSIAWVDRGGMLQVGPQSAGANPGPACYGHRGTSPTTTDAVVHLGWIRPHHFLGGRMRLFPDRSDAALSHLAAVLGQPVDSTAQAVIDIGAAHINRAVRLVSVQRGHDPRGYALYAYGGMGPLVGALVADEMRIRRVILPPYPGLFSALGLLVADLERTFRQTSFASLTSEIVLEVDGIFARLRSEAEAEFGGYGYSPEQIEVETQLEMRYRGQGFELVVPVELEQLAAGGVNYLANQFHIAHLARYGARAPIDAIEIVTYRLVARVPGGRGALEHLERNESGKVAAENATVTYRGEKAPCRFYWRENLPKGFASAGLAIIEEPTATTLVPPGWRFTVGAAGAIVLEKDATE